MRPVSTCVCVCANGDVSIQGQLPGRLGVHDWLLEGSIASVCVCVSVHTCKGVCVPATGVGLEASGACVPPWCQQLLSMWCVCLFLPLMDLQPDQTQRGTGLKLFVLLVQVLCFLGCAV